MKIAEQVSFELKTKDREIKSLKDKLLDIVKLFKDTGIKQSVREKLTLDSLAEVIERCIKRQLYKAKKDKASNRTFQDAMLKELAQLNKDLYNRNK